ncbi:C-GCAxxG-C-C family protein [Oscillospiraceae bacterium OttesenSCG-928-G22]|nr:C-GCAxxG-C-C family protein [Oscillospiraceae bacterium OttesenSCG-928-G22]
MAEQDKRELVKQYAEEAFASGHSCAEAVFDALVRAGVASPPEGSISMLSGFGGGVGLSGYTCGALSGAIMAVGSKHGRDPNKTDASERGSELYNGYYRLYNNLLHKFAESSGGALCREITEGTGEWSGPTRKGTCKKVVGDAVQLAYDFLQMSKEEAYAMPYGENMAGAK